MRVPLAFVFVVIIIFGFLSGSTFYFYNKSRPQGVANHSNVSADTSFKASLPSATDTPQAVDGLTKPADPRDRLSYPANTYAIAPSESLFAISQKMEVSLSLIKQANNITDENVVQAGQVLVVPKLSKETDYYRINFLINDAAASSENRDLRGKDQADQYDPAKVAQSLAAPYFGLTDKDSYTLKQADLSQGTATVEVKKGDIPVVIGLIQPKTKGKTGFWALYYIEWRQT